MSERCETCRFWDEIEGGYGLCRRYPPSLPKTKAQQQESLNAYGYGKGLAKGMFPETNEATWCGEYQPAAKQPYPPPPEDPRKTVNPVVARGV